MLGISVFVADGVGHAYWSNKTQKSHKGYLQGTVHASNLDLKKKEKKAHMQQLPLRLTGEEYCTWKSPLPRQTIISSSYHQ